MFPILHFCSSHYKVDTVATFNYTCWHLAYKKAMVMAKKDKYENKTKPNPGKCSWSIEYTYM